MYECSREFSEHLSYLASRQTTLLPFGHYHKLVTVYIIPPAQDPKSLLLILFQAALKLYQGMREATLFFVIPTN